MLLSRGTVLCPARVALQPSRCARTKSTASITPKRPIAFAFDIDGVLLKSSTPVPGAVESLTLLKQRRIPFILLTNGGGFSEARRVSKLSRLLGVPISADRFVQSHTPFQAHVTKAYRNVLVCGGKKDTLRRLALSYGFERATIPLDLLADNRAVWPHTVVPHDLAAFTQPLQGPINAIYVFHDPIDWGLDSQVIVDTLLMKDGVRTMEQQVPIYFSNPDLLWANAYPYPRFGQGAFQILIKELFRAVTGKDLQMTTIGKPSRVTYEYADDVLHKLQAKMNGKGRKKVTQEKPTVYMVGDNKLSDIQGANDYGWTSILVGTGVFSGTAEEATSGDIPARYFASDVREAVQSVLEREDIEVNLKNT